MVLLSHAPEMMDGNASRELFHRFVGTNMTFGSVGVDGFFILSGYLIVQSWDRDPELWNFLRKRLLRIVPGYAVAVLLSVLVAGRLAPAVPHFFAHLGARFAVSILLLREPITPAVMAGVHPPTVNGSLWSIMYEFRCYLLVALCGLAGLVRKGVPWMAMTVLSFCLAYAPFAQHLVWHRYKMLTGEPLTIYRLTGTFLLGGCFYLYRDRIPYRPATAAAAAALLLLGHILCRPYFELFFVLCAGYLLFYLGQISLRALAFMRHIPDISYGVYLYGWPVEALWTWYRHGSPWVTFAVSCVLCALLGWLSWEFVERPMLTLKRRGTAPLPPP